MKIKLTELKTGEKPKKTSSLKDVLSKDIVLFSNSKFSAKFFQKFYDSLLGLLLAGLDIITALNIIENQHKTKPAATLYSLKTQVAKGAFLSQALKECKEFYTYDAYLIAIGEKTGRLHEILKELEAYYATKVKLKRMLVSALSYPMLVIALSIGVLYFMLGFLIPTFKDIYLRMNIELPVITQLMLDVSDAFSNYAFLLPLGLLLLLAFNFYAKSNVKVQEKTQAILLKIPLLGALLLETQLMRFSHSMYLLLSAKVPITEALDLSAKLLSFIPFKKEIHYFNQEIKKGIAFSDLTQRSPFFDAQYEAMIQVGEQTGRLSEVFEKLFEQKMTQLNYQTKILGDVIEPILIIVIGGMVALVLIAMYLPMFGLSGGI